MKKYKFSCRIHIASNKGLGGYKCFQVKADAMRKGIKYIIEDCELLGYICNYDGTEIAVCRYDGNLCESYTDFKVKALKGSD